MSDDAVFSRVNLSIDVHARVLICCHDVCRVALSPSPAQVSQHLRTKHNIPAAERRLVTDLLKARISPLQSPSEVPVRQDGSSPDPNLHLLYQLPLVMASITSFCGLCTTLFQPLVPGFEYKKSWSVHSPHSTNHCDTKAEFPVFYAVGGAPENLIVMTVIRMIWWHVPLSNFPYHRRKPQADNHSRNSPDSPWPLRYRDSAILYWSCT